MQGVTFIHNVKEAIGTTLLPTVNEFLGKGADVIEKVGVWIDNNQELVRKLMLVAFVLGGILTVGGTTIAVIGSVGLVFTKTAGYIGGFIGVIRKVPGAIDTVRLVGMYAGNYLKKGFLLAKGALTPLTVTITATGGDGASIIRTLTFFKNVTRIKFITRNPHAMTSRPDILFLKVMGAIPVTAAETYYACNNGFDDEPVWEDITAVTKNGYAHTFANKEKARDNWGVRIKVEIDRGDGAGDCYVAGLTYAYKLDSSNAVEAQVAALAMQSRQTDELLDALLTEVLPQLMAGREEAL